MGKKRKILLAIVMLLALLVYWALYQGLVVRRYTVKTEKLPVGANLRAVLLTDFHSGLFGEGQRDLLRKVSAERPDIILLGGDIVDDREPIENAHALFAGLREMGIPTYYVSGNHDRWRSDYAAVRKMIKGYGIAVLEGESVSIPVGDGRILLSGIDDPVGHSDYHRALKKAFSNLPEDTFNLLLAHRPEEIEAYAALSFDLVLAGHAHGGQVRIPPFVNGLFAPNQGWFPKYAGGRYLVENTALIVGRGLQIYPDLPRVFNPPEVVVIDIQGSSAQN